MLCWRKSLPILLAKEVLAQVVSTMNIRRVLGIISEKMMVRSTKASRLMSKHNLTSSHGLITRRSAPCRYPLFPSQVFPSTRRSDEQSRGNRKGCALASSEAQVCLDQGIALFNQGRIHEALWVFFEGVSSHPENPTAHYLSGLGLQALGLGAEAQAEWERVLTLASLKTAPPMEPLETNWSRGLALYLVARS